MQLDTPGLAPFVERQLHESGGNVEIDTGLWALFVVEAADAENNELARSLLAQVPFTYESGSSEDDQWVLYYVDDANRAGAVHWLEDVHHQLQGVVRTPSPAQRRMIKELTESTMPHRVAQKLVEEHTMGVLSAGSVNVPQEVRGLLDRLHLRETLFYSAFQQLLTNHLIDMIVVLQQLIQEDVELTNDAMRGAVSRDPFIQTRQTAAADIRKILVQFSVINSLDQQKNTVVRNPYAAYMDIVRQGDQLILPLDGTNVTVSPGDFVTAVRSIRKNLFKGGEFDRLDTQAPWVQEHIAYPFRFIKRRLAQARGTAPMDGLYMLERAVET